MPAGEAGSGRRLPPQGEEIRLTRASRPPPTPPRIAHDAQGAPSFSGQHFSRPPSSPQRTSIAAGGRSTISARFPVTSRSDARRFNRAVC